MKREVLSPPLVHGEKDIVFLFLPQKEVRERHIYICYMTALLSSGRSCLKSSWGEEHIRHIHMT